MRTPYRLGIIVVIAVVIFSSLALTTVRADSTPPLTPQQQQHIKNDCSLIKSTLTQLQVNDALLRVNRGQFYESMSSKLMIVFDTRLSNNSIDNSKFVGVTNAYNAMLNNFRNDYQTYAQQLSNTLSIDCTARPTQFNNAIISAELLRHNVHDDVIALNQDIANYQSLLTTFAAHYEPAATGVSQ